MRIIGIDPGSRATGYGLIRREGNRLIHIDNGVIRPPDKAELPERLLAIFEGLNTIIGEYKPELAAIEQVFMSRNAQTALKLGQARGAALLALASAGLDVGEYSPMQIKSSVVGYGRAAKNQVQQMVKALLNLPEIAQEDASDALAVAVCHAHSSSRNNQLARATTQSMQRRKV
ncbi:MAG: crossover junction endodeoxyribonuclease RuvC [Desulfuromonas sp.]|nr:MAG: crossover junction endodeoxyribonuclease RuvC [Desulfuromonas sp.]